MNKTMVYGIAVAALTVTSAFAQNESEQLRSEMDALTKRLNELEAEQPEKSKTSWTDKITIKGDLRYRFEYVGKDDSTSKNRQRIRARLGAYADVNDFTTAGIRIRTGGDANSGNQTIGGDFNAKDIYLDLAYITLAPSEATYGAVTLGKMKYPWKVTTDLIWDSDVNPEGAAYTYATKLDNTGLFGSAGYFKVQDTSSTHDLNLGSGQIGASQPIGEKTKLTVGGSVFAYDNSKDFNNPGATNNTTMIDYTIAEVFGEVGFKEVLPIPFKLYGNYVNNTKADNDEMGYCFGIKFGDAKKGKWEAKVGYRNLDLNAAPAYYADSDFAGGGTDIKGGRVKAKYNVGKNLQVGATLIAGTQKSSDTDVNTLHLDLIAKF